MSALKENPILKHSFLSSVSNHHWTKTYSRQSVWSPWLYENEVISSARTRLVIGSEKNATSDQRDCVKSASHLVVLSMFASRVLHKRKDTRHRFQHTCSSLILKTHHPLESIYTERSVHSPNPLLWGSYTEEWNHEKICKDHVRKNTHSAKNVWIAHTAVSFPHTLNVMLW